MTVRQHQPLPDVQLDFGKDKGQKKTECIYVQQIVSFDCSDVVPAGRGEREGGGFPGCLRSKRLVFFSKKIKEGARRNKEHKLVFAVDVASSWANTLVCAGFPLALPAIGTWRAANGELKSVTRSVLLYEVSCVCFVFLDYGDQGPERVRQRASGRGPRKPWPLTISNALPLTEMWLSSKFNPKIPRGGASGS